MNVFLIFITLVFTVFSVSFADSEKPKLCQPIPGDPDQSQYSPDFILSLGLKAQVQANHSRANTQITTFHKKAIQYFQSYITCVKSHNIPVSNSTYFQKATSHFEIKEWNESESDVDLALSLSDNQYKDALILKSRLLIKKNKFKEASDLLESIISYYSEDSDILYFLGSLNAEIENYPKTILYFTLLYNLI